MRQALISASINVPDGAGHQAKPSRAVQVHCRPEPAPNANALVPMVQRLAALSASLCVLLSPAPPAAALLNSPNAQVPRTAEAALRRSIPAFNEDVSEMQKELERIQFKLRIPQRKPWGTMAEDVADAARRASNEATVLRGVLPADVPKAKQLVEEVQAELGRLAAAVSLKDPDRTSIRVANALERVAALELLQAPGLPYRLPAQYASLPRLTGRATVEMVVERSDGRAVFIADGSEDGPQKQAVLEVTLDGYSAPITAGNFVKNVMAGLYNGKELKVNEVSVLAGEDKQGALPLEAMIAGDFEPVYRTPLDVRGGELPVLPLSIYGSVAMQNLPPGSQAPGVVSDQEFFIYKFVRQQSGLAGLSFDEGQFGVFGYVTKGADLLPRIEDGDRLVRVRVVSGADKLVIPAEQQKVE